MTRTLERDLATYLRTEADRVAVHDSLADIEDGITLVPVSRSPKRTGSLLPLMVAAAAIVVVGLLMARDVGRPEGRPATQPDATVVATAAPATTATPDTTPPTTVPILRVPLPAGAVLQGLPASCTTIDSIEFDCTIPAYPDIVLIDMTGYTTPIVDDTSHVSGGCRATSADALRWTCFVGQRSIDEGIVAASSLGDWAPREYAAG